MELNSKSIHDVIHPTAAFAQSLAWTQPGGAAAEVGSWSESQLNPKNRIDSLDDPKNPLWRIDGGTGLGTQYYIVPLFLDAIPPMRFDVFIPEEATSCPHLRQLLDLNAAFHTKDAVRVRRLGIAKHIIRTLQAWTEAGGDGGPASVSRMYRDLPFGSRIIFENLNLDIRKIKITVAPTYYVEKQLIGLRRLEECLGLPPDILPVAVDISRLEVVQQLHDSVSLVRMNAGDDGHEKLGQPKPRNLWILKALTSGTKYLYSELRNLMRLKPHPHIISRPTCLITKYCRFGGKTGVVGFLIPYYATGSLRDVLPPLRIHGQLTLETQLKWATQLVSAVLHIREQGHIFYPDLRLDNVVISDAGDVVMIDFEQRGVWCEFAAPEVNALEYFRILASGDPFGGQDTDLSIPEHIRDHYAALLSQLLPDWDALQAREDYAPLPHGYDGYNVPWQCLSSTEQEAAEVYMLGRLLWCIFEGESAPQNSAVWQSYQWEPDLEFPEFHRTPAKLRDLVDRCTRGRRTPLSSLIVRRASKLVLRAGKPDEMQDADEVRRAARQWWTAEVKAAEDFLQMRERRKIAGEWDENHFNRPTLREVAAFLEDYQTGSDLGH